MKISSKFLARVCVALLVLYPVAAFLVWAYPTRDDCYGILAALLAANAGTAVFVRLVFGLPEFSEYTSGALRLYVVIIGVGSGLASALSWMADEVDNIWLRLGIISPVLVIILLLMWFIDKVSNEGTSNEGE